MSTEYQGPVVVFGGDAEKLIKAAKAGDQAVINFAKSASANLAGFKSAGEKSFDSLNARVAKLANELKGNGATAKLRELEMAVEKIGGTSKMTGVQLDNVRRRVDSLVASGAKLTPMMAKLSGQGNLGDLFKGASAEKLQALSASTGTFGSVLAKIGPGGLAAGAGVGALLMVGKGLATAAQDAADYAAKITDATVATDMTAEGAQRLEHACVSSGTGFDVATAAIVKMRAAIVDTPEKFERIGLSIENLKKLQPEEQFKLVGETLARIEDDELRTSIATDILGKSWKELAPLLTGGLDKMAAFKPMSADLIGAMNAQKTGVNELQDAWNKLWITIGASKPVREVTGALTDELSRIAKFLQGDLGGSIKKGGALDWLMNAGKPSSGPMQGMSIGDLRRSESHVIPGPSDEERKKAEREREEALKKQQAQLEAAAKLLASYTGAGAQEDLDKLTKMFVANEAAIEGNASGFKKLIEEVERLRDAGAKLPAVFEEITGRKGQMVGPQTPGSFFGVENLKRPTAELDVFKPEAFAGVIEGTRSVVGETQSWSDRLGDVAHQVQLIGGGGGIGAILSGFASGAAGIEAMGKALTKTTDILENGKKVGEIKTTGLGQLGKGGFGAVAGQVMAGLQIAQTALSVGKALVGALSRSLDQKIADEVGANWGAKISDATAKSIVETMGKSGVGKQMAELLNIGKIMADDGGDPSKFKNKIEDLMNAVKLGSVPAKEGIESIGDAFTELQKSAEAGSTTSRIAMVDMIKRANQLGLKIPAIQDAVKGMLADAAGQMKTLLGSFGSVGKDGKFKAGMSAGQSAASSQILGSVFSGQSAQVGVVEATESMREAIEAMLAALPAGEKLTGPAAEAAQMLDLLNEEGFKKAAEGGAAAGKVLKDLADSASLSQETMDAFGVTGKTLFDQAFAGAKNKGLSDDEARKAAERANLPLLTQMQHAEAMGLVLSPEAHAMLEQAQRDGILPMLGVAEQSLAVLKQIRDGTKGDPTTPPPDGGGGGGGGGGGDGGGGDPGGHPTGGGRDNHGFAADLIMRGNQRVPSAGGHARGAGRGASGAARSHRGGGGVAIHVGRIEVHSNNADPRQVAQLVGDALYRQVAPRLKSAIKDVNNGEL